MGQDSPARNFVTQAERRINPIDVVEAVLRARAYAYERAADDQLSLISGGNWTDYRIGFNYLPDCEGLQITLLFDPRVPERRAGEVMLLLALINAQNWLGHFDFWDEERVIAFRYGMPLRGARLSRAQCEDMLDLTLETCEAFFPALQYVLWAGMSARDAVRACLLETKGEA